MSFQSFLSAVGKDAKAVFAFLGSTKGQQTVAAVEGAAETAGAAFGLGAPIQAGITLVNTWMVEAIKAEQLAVAAGTQNGTGAQKTAVVLSAMTPELTAFLQGQGLTSQQITDKATALNNAVVSVLNTLTVPTSGQSNQQIAQSATPAKA